MYTCYFGIDEEGTMFGKHLPVLKNSEVTQKQPVHTGQAEGVMDRCFASSGDQTDTFLP